MLHETCRTDFLVYKKMQVVMCYYGSWAAYHWDLGYFDVENIDPFACTHIIYGFAGLDSYSSQMISLDPYLDLQDNFGKGGWDRLETTTWP